MAMATNKLPERSSEYWARRLKLMEDALLNQSYSYMENLDAQFRIAQAEIERQVAAWYQRFADNNEITLADAKRLLNSGELEEFRWTVEEYIKHGEENALTGAWMKERKTPAPESISPGWMRSSSSCSNKPSCCTPTSLTLWMPLPGGSTPAATTTRPMKSKRASA